MGPVFPGYIKKPSWIFKPVGLRTGECIWTAVTIVVLFISSTIPVITEAARNAREAMPGNGYKIEPTSNYPSTIFT
jgi:hypothetical protein